MESEVVIAKIELAKEWLELVGPTEWREGGQESLKQMTNLFDQAYKAITVTLNEAQETKSALES